MNRSAIKAKALEMAAEQLGAGRVTRIGNDLIDQAAVAAMDAVEIAVQRALAQHKRTSKTLRSGAGALVIAPRSKG